jgi:hypothetical protein
MCPTIRRSGTATLKLRSAGTHNYSFRSKYIYNIFLTFYNKSNNLTSSSKFQYIDAMKKRTRKIQDENTLGPNTGFILRAIQLLNKGKTLVHNFGSTYRSFPVRIKKVQKTKNGLKITGTLDYSNFPNVSQAFNGIPAVIKNYNPRTQRGSYVC